MDFQPYQPNTQNFDVDQMAALLFQQEQQKAPEERLSQELLKQNLLNGLNSGNADAAQWIKDNNIKTPQTEEEIANAKIGQFNTNLGDFQATIQGKPSFLDNLSTGFKDNFNNPIAVKNFRNTNKPFSERFGEGLGTVARIANSPLGRGLLSAGIMAVAGGSPAMSLATGLGAGTNNYNAMTADALYRNQLKQMGIDENDMPRGYIDNDTFKNITTGMRLGNQRMTYGQLAMFDDDVAEYVKNNPEMYNQFLPITFANSVYAKKRALSDANIDKSKAQTGLIKAQTNNVGKPKYTYSKKYVVVDNNYNNNGGGGKNDNNNPKPQKATQQHKTNAF